MADTSGGVVTIITPDVIAITKKAIATIVIARYTTDLSTRRLLITVSSRPLEMLTTVATKTTKVVVLIPPPVDEGEAPINIKIIVTSFVASPSSPWGIVA